MWKEIIPVGGNFWRSSVSRADGWQVAGRFTWLENVIWVEAVRGHVRPLGRFWFCRRSLKFIFVHLFCWEGNSMQWLIFCGSEGLPNKRKVLVYRQYWFHNSLWFFFHDFLIKMFCVIISIGLDYLRAQGTLSSFFSFIETSECIHLLLHGRRILE